VTKRSWGFVLARGRVKAVDRITRWMLGPQVGRWPLVYARSLAERAEFEDVTGHVLNTQFVSGPVVVDYPFPESYPLCFRREKAFDAIPVHEVTDVLADPASGLIWLPDGPVLAESYGSLQKSISWDDVRHVPLMKRATPVVRQPAVVMGITGYFHFLLEVLPAVLRALQVRPDAVVVVAEGALPPYAEQAIDLLGLTDRVQPLAGTARFSHLVFSAIPEHSGFVDPDAVRIVCNALGTQPAGDRSGPPLYLSRADATARSVPNETDLEAALAEQGFQIVRPSQLGLADQIRLLSGARAVVGLHGAALTNLIWAPTGIPVLELHPWPAFNDCYGRLALTCGLDYRALTIPRTRHGGLSDVVIEGVAHEASRMLLPSPAAD